jgi:Tfp pilus assembly ATPase PilU
MEQVELDNAEQKVGSYLNVMVTNDGSDLFLHTGAKSTIKGSFGF